MSHLVGNTKAVLAASIRESSVDRFECFSLTDFVPVDIIPTLEKSNRSVLTLDREKHSKSNSLLLLNCCCRLILLQVGIEHANVNHIPWMLRYRGESPISYD